MLNWRRRASTMLHRSGFKVPQSVWNAHNNFLYTSSSHLCAALIILFLSYVLQLFSIAIPHPLGHASLDSIDLRSSCSGRFDSEKINLLDFSWVSEVWISLHVGNFFCCLSGSILLIEFFKGERTGMSLTFFWWSKLFMILVYLLWF